MVNSISIIGAGIMGRGIAYTAAISGYTVTLHDISTTSLQRAQQEIEQIARQSMTKGFISTQQQQAVEQIQYTTSIEQAATNAELVIEAVVERIEVKTTIFKQLDTLCPPETILATNTSSLSPTEIGCQTNRPHKVLAMHFFNPVHKMKLIEIIRGLDTSDETVKTIKQIAKQMQKESVEVHEFPGFVTSRMNALIGNEAMNMLMEGVASAEDIDKAIKLGLNHPMGPLEMGDLVGLDTRLRTLEYLHKTLGEKYRPSPILVKYVKAGRLGRKTGKGFYNYEECEQHANT
ncbi:3-hydroxyacyl-CoA dehydrogenase [Lysinibacillus sp. NPDC097231]|uniref:3-hydroxyacyl-CoA dehydrogenase n=1 Tax=Lysinibacillus sp. NPDC097231 TaxID=3364142 RepID=UPI00382BB1E9